MPQGRILLKRICQSRKMAALKTDGARLLYAWLIPNLDINGCYHADPYIVAGRIFSRLRKSAKTVQSYIDDLEDVRLILVYKANSDTYLCVPDFVEKQPKLNPDREASPTIPPPTHEQLMSKSFITPRKTKAKRSESKSKVKSKVKRSKVDDSEISPSGVSDRFDSGNAQIKTIKLNDLLAELLGVQNKGDKTCYRRVANMAFARLQENPESKICTEIWETAQRCAKDGQNPRAMFVAAMQEIGILEKKQNIR